MAVTVGAGSSNVRTTAPVPTSSRKHGASSRMEDTTRRDPHRSKSTAGTGEEKKAVRSWTSLVTPESTSNHNETMCTAMHAIMLYHGQCPARR